MIEVCLEREKNKESLCSFRIIINKIAKELRVEKKSKLSTESTFSVNLKAVATLDHSNTAKRAYL